MLAALLAMILPLKVFNIDSGLTNSEVRTEVARGLRTVRRKGGKRFRVGQVVDVRDESPPLLQTTGRYLWFEKELGSGIYVYQSRYKNAYGVARICNDVPTVAAAIDEEAPQNFLKYVVAHEMGHVLGAGHREPLFACTDYTKKRRSIMEPFWNRFFDSIEGNCGDWKYVRRTIRQWEQCNKFSTVQPEPLVCSF